MSLPEPKPGLVIRYAYMWRDEANRGREDSSKDRPCAVVLAAKREGGQTVVVVAPITHSPPRGEQTCVEIPASTKKRLGLDDDRSWIVTDELNVFTWPGPDIRPIDLRNPGKGFAYGYLPGPLAQKMIDNVRQERQRGRSRIVSRDDRGL